MTLKYTIVGTEEGSNITVFVEGHQPQVAHSSHPNYDQIVAGAIAQDESVIDLFDVSKMVAEKFEKLSERVSVANGRLYFDGEEVDNSLADQVVRFMDEGVEDYKPLVNFFENVQNNPNEHSRNQLYPWITEQNITITPDGLMVGYKGVERDAEGNLVSRTSGTAISNGVKITGRIPNPIGAVVEMPRTAVMHNPQADCDAGLHVGSFEYAKGYGTVVVEVHVNPRDVVSVPDASWKLRTCRYTVVGEIEVPYESAFVSVMDDELWRETEDDGHNHDLHLFDAVEEDETEVPTLEYDVQVGDVFQTTDKRRAGTQFKVESIEGDEAVGKSLPSNLTRKVNLDRLTSYRYKRVKPKKRKK